ncbi:nuclear transport factor 2 family protein [Paraburkholderia sp. GAS334]|uniref:nuclear transport factor 2 family protein n=1 Tax=Paraburkholderia sp. GAS334 TaxID=3035131 RepID=UPI003D21B643
MASIAGSPVDSSWKLDMSYSSEQAQGATRQVLDHHLGAFANGLDEILKDYDDNSTLITPDRTFRGRDEITGFFKAFLDGADPAFWPAFKITSLSTAGEIAYLAWEAKPWVTLATDTLFIKDGKIAVQTFTSFSA